MRFIKKFLTMILSITLIICSTLPSLAQKNGVQESTVDVKIIEQLKNDLGVEKSEKILAKLSLDDDDLFSSVSNDYLLDDSSEELLETTENLNESSQVEHTYDSNDDLEDDLVQNEFEEEAEEDEQSTDVEEELEESENLIKIEEELEENDDLTKIDLEQDNVVSTTCDNLEESNNFNNIESSIDDNNSDERENEITNTASIEIVESEVSEENLDTGIIDSQNIFEEDNSKKNGSTKNDNNNENVSDSSIGSDITSENEANKVDTADAKDHDIEQVENNNIINDSNNETIITDNTNEISATAESNNELNYEEDIVAIDSEVKELIDDLEGLVATISDIEENIASNSEVHFGVGEQVHYLSNSWYDENLTNISKKNVNFIRFVNDGHEPIHTAVYDLDNSGLKLYVDESHGGHGNQEVTVTIYIFIPEGDTLCADENASSMFSFAEAGGPDEYISQLRGIYNLELLDTRNVTNMSSMFEGNRMCANCDVSSFNTSSVTNMRHMFAYCNSGIGNNSATADRSYDVSNFDTRNVTNMSGMFYQGRSNYVSRLINLDVSEFDTSNVTDMSYMFSGCSQLTNLDLSGFDTSNVTDMSYMFFGCSQLTNLDLSGFDTSNVTNMDNMFSACSQLTNLDLSGFNTSNVSSMFGMFYYCTNLQSVDVSSFNMENVSDMRNMFYGCSQLASLDLTSFVNMNYYVDMVSLFENCSNLTTIYVVEDFYNNYANVSEQYNNTMFEGCTSLIGGNGTHYSDEHKYAEYARIDTASTPGYFTYREPPAVTLESISINTNPTKVTYIVGERFNPAGLKIKLNYSDDSDEVVTYNNTTKNDFSFNPSLTTNLATSNNRVVVTYSGKTANIPITVSESGGGDTPATPSEVTLNSIEVVTRPTVTSYTAGNRLNPAGLVIKLTYSDNTTENITYNDSTKSRFTFNPSFTTNLTTSHNAVTITYGGKTTTFAISVTSGGSSVVPSGGSRGGSSGGGGGGGGMLAASRTAPETSYISVTKTISGSVDSATSRWVSDPITGKWKLNVMTSDGGTAPLSNGFYQVNYNITQVINNISVPTVVNNTYYFDESGNMVTGWIKTGDNKWFFFDNAKTSEEGKMAIGWKQVENAWYYFTTDGSMVENGLTPDGFMVGADGRWIQQ